MRINQEDFCCKLFLLIASGFAKDYSVRTPKKSVAWQPGSAQTNNLSIKHPPPPQGSHLYSLSLVGGKLRVTYLHLSRQKVLDRQLSKLEVTTETFQQVLALFWQDNVYLWLGPPVYYLSFKRVVTNWLKDKTLAKKTEEWTAHLTKHLPIFCRDLMLLIVEYSYDFSEVEEVIKKGITFFKEAKGQHLATGDEKPLLQWLQSNCG